MKKVINRKDFFKVIGAAGIGSVMSFMGAGCKSKKEGTEKVSQANAATYPQIPRRRLGRRVWSRSRPRPTPRVTPRTLP